MKDKKIHRFIRSIPILLLLPFASQGQGIEITTGGGNIVVTGAASIELNNQGFINNGTYTKGAETVSFTGTAAKTISGTSNTTMNDLVISNTGGITTQVGLLTTNNLSIASGSKFTIDPIKQVTVNGTLANNAGNGGLVIKSTVTGTGSLKHITAGVTGTVERYIAAAIWGTWDDGWHFLSSPVVSQTISPEFVPSAASTNEDFYKWDEPGNIWINIKDGTGWRTGFETEFVVGRGYLVAYAGTVTKNFTGSFNVSDVSVSGLAITSGTYKSWHLLGNPYTSALSWYTGWTKSNIGGVANIWNEIGRGYSPVNAGEIIPAGNGFMVQASGGTGSLTIPAASRVHSVQAWYKSGGYPVIKLVAHNVENSSFQESQVRFNPESTSGFDLEYDGNFLPGYAPLFYSVMEGEKLIVNSIPEFNAETVIPFHFIKNEGANFTIEAKGIETLNTTDNVYLKDKKLGIDYNLSENNIYPFTALAGDAADRFELSFKSFTGVKETENASKFNVFLSDGILNIQSLNQLTGKVLVTDMVGRTIATGRIEAGATTQINIHGNTGVYIVSVLTNKGRSNSKVIVR